MLADTYVTVNGQRSRYFGPDASYTVGGNGVDEQQPQQRLLLPADHRQRHDRAPARARAAARPAPEMKEARARLRRRLQPLAAETGVDNISDPSCRGKPWVRPITEMDAYRRFYQLGLIASQGVAIDGIAISPSGRPVPPSPQEIPGHPEQPAQQAAARRRAAGTQLR